MTTEEFEWLMGKLRAAYPSFDFPMRSLAVYQGRLKRLPYDVGVEAADRWIDTSKFFPSIAELLMLAAEVSPRERGPQMRDCPRCDGTAWVETEPRLGEDGEPFPRPEAGWVVKCRACRGTGRAPAGPAETPPPSDDELAAMWAAAGFVRGVDGRMYDHRTGRVPPVQPPERVLPPLPDGSRPAPEDRPPVSVTPTLGEL